MRKSLIRKPYGFATGQGRFDLGVIVGSPEATVALQRAFVTARSLLERHISGDFGDIVDLDWEYNEEAIERGNRRITSMYRLWTGSQIVVMTESDRSVTTLFTAYEW